MPLTTTASRNFLRPNAYGCDCIFVNPFYVWYWYQSVVAITCCCSVCLMLLISTQFLCPHSSLVSTHVFYLSPPSPYVVVVSRQRYPHHPKSLMSTISHLYRSVQFPHIYNAPSSYFCCLTILRLLYDLGNLPGDATSDVANHFLFPTISYKQLYFLWSEYACSIILFLRCLIQSHFLDPLFSLLDTMICLIHLDFIILLCPASVFYTCLHGTLIGSSRPPQIISARSALITLYLICSTLID